MRKYLIIFLAFPLVCVFASCAAPAPAASDYNIVATIKDIMDSAVDPSADYIWESIGTEVSAAGIVDPILQRLPQVRPHRPVSARLERIEPAKRVHERFLDEVSRIRGGSRPARQSAVGEAAQKWHVPADEHVEGMALAALRPPQEFQRRQSRVLRVWHSGT
jgi:hypothetical protein